MKILFLLSMSLYRMQGLYMLRGKNKTNMILGLSLYTPI